MNPRLLEVTAQLLADAPLGLFLVGDSQRKDRAFAEDFGEEGRSAGAMPLPFHGRAGTLLQILEYFVQRLLIDVPEPQKIADEHERGAQVGRLLGLELGREGLDLLQNEACKDLILLVDLSADEPALGIEGAEHVDKLLRIAKLG